MTSNSSILGGFYDASTARHIAVGQQSGNLRILPEINTIKVRIDAAAGGGALQVLVGESQGDTVAMAAYDNYQGPNTSSHYDAFSDPNSFVDDIHVRARAEMDQVIAYFTRLGYTIKRERDGTNNRFDWLIKW